MDYGMVTAANASHGVCQVSRRTTWWNRIDDRTVVALSVFGVQFVFNLQATPLDRPGELPSDLIAEYWLGDEARGEAS